MFTASPLTHSPVYSQIVAHTKSASSQSLQGLFASLALYFLPQLCSCRQITGGQDKSSSFQSGCPDTAPAPCPRAPADFHFKDSMKGEEKGLIFHQPVPFSLHPSLVWFPVPVRPNPITPPHHNPKYQVRGQTLSWEQPCSN